MKKFEDWYEKAVKRGLGKGDEFTFSAAIKCYMKAGQKKKALAVIERAKDAGVEANEVIFGALLSGFAQIGDFDSANVVWTYLSTNETAPELDTVLYTNMIHACGKAGRGEKALLLLEDMRADGLVPTEVTYNAALYAVARRVDMWEDAKDLFEGMRSKGMEPTEHTMNTILLSAAKAGEEIEKLWTLYMFIYLFIYLFILFF